MPHERVSLNPGLVYILRNPALKSSLVKVGMTTRSSEQRAWELSGATGVPARFEVLYEEDVVDCELAERLIHRDLERFRLRRDREFFDVPLKTAVNAVFQACLRVNAHLLLEQSRLVIYTKLAPPSGAFVSDGLLQRSESGLTGIRFVLRTSDACGELDLGDDHLIHCTPALVSQLQRQSWIEEVAFLAANDA